MDVEFQNIVLAAAGREEVVSAVRGVYERVQKQIDLRRPLCVASGRCCRFEAFGHRLFVTTIELAAFVRELPDAAVQMTDPGGCPFQVAKLCSVHGIRPFGCRIFFCDATAEGWQQEQYEAFHGQIKRLHESLGVDYFYTEWRSALERVGLLDGSLSARLKQF